jgi:exodeoxyribonuclease V alpha subunit
MNSLNGKITKIIYSNEENGYFVAVLEDDTKIVGHYISSSHEDLVDSEVFLQGEYSESKYGKQFNFEFLEIKQEPILFFFEKVIKGVGKIIANRLLKEFSKEELEKILDENPKKLLSITGISEKNIIKISKSWSKFKNIKELSLFLLPFGVTQLTIINIYQTLKEIDDLVNILKKNPYILTTVNGIGFKKCDEIAMKLGFDENSPIRYRACIYYVIQSFAYEEGDSLISYPTLFELVSNEIQNFDKLLFDGVISKMIEAKKLVMFGNDKLTIKELYEAEKYVFDFLNESQESEYQPLNSDLSKFLKSSEFELSDKQKDVLKIINNGVNLVAVTGYAGSGKSTVSKLILNLLENKYSRKDIVCVALSGIASQRIYDVTGYKSSTIQSLLVKYQEKEEFDFKVLLIDECSMINSEIFYAIFKKVSKDMKIILIGDDGQLPPIGAGNLFANFIHSNLLRVIKLDIIFRQSPKQAITFIANEIRNGRNVELKEEYDDFLFISQEIKEYFKLKNELSKDELKTIRDENNQKILEEIEEIVTLYKEKLDELKSKREYKKFISLFQIISPMKNYLLGVENLNKVAQNILNPLRGVAFNAKTYQFRIKDKVLHTKNINMEVKSVDKDGKEESDEARILNGMIGMIDYIDLSDKNIIVYYPNDDIYVDYSFKEANELLELAYAITIHKSQGMEYENLVFPLTFSHYNMLSRELIYTAITRAKKMLYLVGEKRALDVGIKRESGHKRETVFKVLLEETQKDF